MNMAKLSCLKQRLLVTNMSNFLLVVLLMAPFLRQLRLLNIPANTKKKHEHVLLKDPPRTVIEK